MLDQLEKFVTALEVLESVSHHLSAALIGRTRVQVWVWVRVRVWVWVQVWVWV